MCCYFGPGVIDYTPRQLYYVKKIYYIKMIDGGFCTTGCYFEMQSLFQHILQLLITIRSIHLVFLTGAQSMFSKILYTSYASIERVICLNLELNPTLA